MTDSEIVKALEESISFDEPYESDFTLIRIEHIKNTLDLINRLQAENERLNKENKLLIDYDVSNKYPNCVLVEKGRIYTRTLEDYDNLIGNISAEAYKECIEKVKALFPSDNEPYQYWEIYEGADNLLKELVGEDN